MAERSRDRMDQAHRDVEHARASIENGHFERACFAAQQAAEEAVKAGLLHEEGRRRCDP